MRRIQDYSKTMNPETYIHNDLGNICFNEAVKGGDKITTYQFDSDEQVALIDFIRMVSNDHHLDVNDVLLRYIPDIESKTMVYTFIRDEKCRGDKLIILQTEGGEETHINLYDAHNCFYSFNS